MTFLERLPNKRPLLADLFLGVGLVLLLTQAFFTFQQVKNSALAAESPIHFKGEWVPEKEVYHPGELVRFTFERDIIFDEGEEQLLMVAFDSFENVQTSETYAGVMVGRVVEQGDHTTPMAVRQLPEKMNPGNYVLGGWVSAATSRRSMPASYKSKPFRVEPKPPILEMPFVRE